MTQGILSAAFALLVWGVTFASTRALLVDFSALEIQVIRFALAWVVLRGMEAAARRRGRSPRPTGVTWLAQGASTIGGRCGAVETTASTGSEWLFVGMGLTGVFVYQFLENCAIYYTNASNVAILVSFGPVVTALMAKLFCPKSESIYCNMWIGAAIAIGGVALVSFNNAVVFEIRPLGDVMALGAMVSWGVYSVLLDKANERGISPLVATRKAFGWALVFMLPLAAWGASDGGFYVLDGTFSVTLDATENAARFARAMNLVNLFFLGVLASALSFIAWSKACAVLGVVRTTICLYLEPIIGVAFAALFLGERPTLMSAAGGVLIVAGVAIANKVKSEK